MGPAGACAGTGAGNAENDTPPQAVEGDRLGKRGESLRFLGPVRPVTNSKRVHGTQKIKQKCEDAMPVDETQDMLLLITIPHIQN